MEVCFTMPARLVQSSAFQEAFTRRRAQNLKMTEINATKMQKTFPTMKGVRRSSLSFALNFIISSSEGGVDMLMKGTELESGGVCQN